MQAGSGRNVVPASALLKVETRGASDVINQYVFDRAQQAIQGAATMYGVGVETRLMGAATASSLAAMGRMVAKSGGSGRGGQSGH